MDMIDKLHCLLGVPVSPGTRDNNGSSFSVKLQYLRSHLSGSLIVGLWLVEQLVAE